MSRLIDMTGQRIGRLTVIKRADDIVQPSGRRIAAWECACDCGNTVVVSGDCLRRTPPTRSCGCYNHDRQVELHTTHNGTSTRLYGIWCAMKSRCYNPHNRSYKNYGGRGITMCELWRDSYEEFEAWAKQAGYEKDLSIDRIDNNGIYCPENCRWVDSVAQANNRRSNVLLTYNGKTQNVTAWARELGKDPKRLFAKIYAGKSVEEILSA